MSTVETLIKSYEFNRDRTLGLLDGIEKLPDPRAALAWRPAAGRAHIGWQLTHIGVTEEIFATERLAPQKQGKWAELWPRFRGGSTPDDDVPTIDTIREILADGRRELLATLSSYSEAQLQEVPEGLKARNWRVLDALHVIAWHEGHHQGQAHITLNLFKAAHGIATAPAAPAAAKR
jgi:uncharacterized damage-inducible protein DinB